MNHLLDHPSLSQRYFFPRAELIENSLMVQTHDGEQLSCIHHCPFPEGMTVVFWHGNGETVNDYVRLFPALFEQLGCNVLLVEYRGYGQSTGSPKFYSQLQDVQTVIDALGVPADKLIAFGRSVGGIYALEAIYRYPEMKGIILESAVSEVLERVLIRVTPDELGVTDGDLKSAVNDAFGLQPKWEHFKGKTLVLHAEDDSIVNLRHAVVSYNHAPEPKELIAFPRGDHNGLMYYNQDAYLAALAAFFEGLS